MCLLIQDLESFILYLKGKHSIGKELHGLAVRGEQLLT